MSSEGQPLQIDLFSGALVDNRSDYQKRKDKNRSAPQQLQLFRTPEMVQYGVSARPWLKDAPRPTLVLEVQDTRTPEEIERAIMREAEKHTVSFFDAASSDNPASNLQEDMEANRPPSSGVLFDAQCCPQPIGVRARLRAQRIPVRARRYPMG